MAKTKKENLTTADVSSIQNEELTAKQKQTLAKSTSTKKDDVQTTVTSTKKTKKTNPEENTNKSVKNPDMDSSVSVVKKSKSSSKNNGSKASTDTTTKQNDVATKTKTKKKNNEPEQLAISIPNDKTGLVLDEPINSSNPFTTIFCSIGRWFKKRKEGRKKKKFAPVPYNQVTRFSPTIKNGLNSEQVATRMDQDLYNAVAQKYSKSYSSIFLGNICTFFNLLCIIVFVALLIVGAKITDYVFVLVFLTNICIGIIQEIRAKRSIEKLSLLSSKTTKVIRNGEEVEISTKEIVLDDIIKYSIGNQVSTDCIIKDGVVEVNEALLTGESVAVKKTVGDQLFAGSFITSGSCIAKADKVGKENYIEQLSAKAKKYKKPNSELLNSMQLFITVIGLLIIPIAIATFLKHINLPDYDLSKTVEYTAPVIIGMIPAGMFLLTSMALAVGVIRLARNNTLVQDLYSLEMLARVDVLCLDKTGTITDGRMKVNDCLLLNNSMDNTIGEIMGSMLCALDDNNQTSIALYNHFGHNSTLKPIKVLPFNSDRKLSAVTFEDVGTFAFGAPEFVLKEIPEKIDRMIKQYASMGLRVLILAHSKTSIVGENAPANLKSVALITITDNIREDTVSTIKWFKENGVKVKVISGDNPITVAEVARRVGIEDADKFISLEGLSDKDVAAIADKYTVFGRVTPEQKAILIKSLKSVGHTTAMTGDGVNDILALKEADCAITMASGSDAARNVSHLVLMDSNFSSMPKVVHEGRRVINNIQGSASLYLMKTFFVMLLSLYALSIPGMNYPFTLSNMTIMEVLIIGVPSFLLSLQANDNKVEGKFMSHVISKSLPGGILMFLSVIILDIPQASLAGIYPGLDESTYIAMKVITVTFAGLIILYRICEPCNVYRATMFSIITIVLVIWGALVIANGFELSNLEKFPPLRESWHHLLIVFSVVLIDIPASNWLQKAANKIRMGKQSKKL